MKKGNFITAGLFSLLGIYIIATSLTFPPGVGGIPGAGLFPIIIAVLMLTAALSLTISTIRMAPADNVNLGLLSKENIRVYLCMGGLVLYVVLMPLVGFCVCSFLMLFGFIKWFGGYKYIFCVLCAAVVTAAIYLVFSNLLHVPLRFGILF